MRDNRLRNEGLQTDTFPTATFKLTTPVAVPAAALAGTASDVTLTGDLTLHGVTKSVSIPAKAQLVNGVVSVAGSLSFPLSDYSITAPNIGGFIVSIADTGHAGVPGQLHEGLTQPTGHRLRRPRESGTASRLSVGYATRHPRPSLPRWGARSSRGRVGRIRLIRRDHARTRGCGGNTSEARVFRPVMRGGAHRTVAGHR